MCDGRKEYFPKYNMIGSTFRLRFAAKINKKISLKENDGRPLKSSSTVGI